MFRNPQKTAGNIGSTGENPQFCLFAGSFQLPGQPLPLCFCLFPGSQLLKKKHSPGLKIDKQAFNDAIDLLYDMMGWDEEGIPKKSKLIELDVAWVVNEIHP